MFACILGDAAKHPGHLPRLADDLGGQHRGAVAKGAGLVGGGLIGARVAELLEEASVFHCLDVRGVEREVLVPAGGLAFTYCQVPILYRLGDNAGSVTIRKANGDTATSSNLRLDRETSAAVFERRGEIEVIEVTLPAASVTRP